MRTLFAFAVIVTSLNSFAFTKCVNISDQDVTIKIESSERTSFKGCPESVMLADKFVKNLSVVETTEEGKQMCIYGGQGIMLKCEL